MRTIALDIILKTVVILSLKTEGKRAVPIRNHLCKSRIRIVYVRHMIISGFFFLVGGGVGDLFSAET